MKKKIEAELRKQSSEDETHGSTNLYNKIRKIVNKRCIDVKTNINDEMKQKNIFFKFLHSIHVNYDLVNLKFFLSEQLDEFEFVIIQGCSFDSVFELFNRKNFQYFSVNDLKSGLSFLLVDKRVYNCLNIILKKYSQTNLESVILNECSRGISFESLFEMCEKEYTETKIEFWPIVKDLDNGSFLETIELISVFGLFGSEVVMLTYDDRVFSFGDLEYGCTKSGCLSEIKELQGKKVIKFAHGLIHSIALTSNGHLYSWGQNSLGQLGNGTDVAMYEPKLVNFLQQEMIIDVCCGAYHSIALAYSGEVYYWGNNLYSHGEVESENSIFQYHYLPVRVEGLDPNYITAISCGDNYSLVLTENGLVYGWGDNRFGQLGIDNFDSIKFPLPIVATYSTPIEKIVCGSNHNLFLTRDGEILTFGCNKFGQLGNCREIFRTTPEKLNQNDKFFDICSSIDNNLSIAMTISGEYWYWGEYGEENIFSPTLAKVHSMHNIYAQGSIKSSKTYRNVSFKNKIFSFNSLLDKDVLIKQKVAELDEKFGVKFD